MTTEIEQMRERVAAAWGVEVNEIDFWNEEKASHLFTFVSGEWALRMSRGRTLFVIHNGKYRAVINTGNNEANKALTHTELGSNVYRVARFLYCMSYGVECLEVRGVTVTGHDKLEWAQQMKERGFALNSANVS